jgi:putative redox protein
MSDVVVTETGGGYSQQIEAGNHILTADEPVRSGGTDTGPDPYALLLAALGACTSMTIRMYAARKQWPLEGVTVRLRHERDYKKDCENCEEPDARIERIVREITLKGPLTEEQRARFLEIANLCPVHRTLTSEKQIVSTLVPA